MHCTVDQEGRVAIPKPIRDELQLSPGSILEIVEEGGKFVLTRGEETGLIRKKGVLIYAGEVREDLTHSVEEERYQRLDHLASFLQE